MATKVAVKRILDPFKNAETDQDLMLAQGKLRRAVRRGEETDDDVRAAAASAPEDLTPVLLRALVGTEKVSTIALSVAEHRAAITEVLANRHGERRIHLGIWKALVDILEVLGTDR